MPAWPDLLSRLGGHSEGQAEVRLNSGATQHIDARLAPLSARHGQTTGRLLLLRDITERKLLDELRDDLMHALVHDLRNPLAGINGSLEVLVDEAPSAVQREMLQIARANAERMLGLIDSILDVNRLESGSLPLERRAVGVGALVGEVVQLQRLLARERRIQVTATIPEEVPAVLVDPRLATRVLHNLLDNAIKFTPPGGMVEVTARRDNGWVAVSVGDNGSGIPEMLRGRLFRKFVAGRGPGHGSGLGLAFCRLAVEAHGGRIWVAASSTAGTTITFTLPVSE
jgi:signal transduction histidine kinase